MKVISISNQKGGVLKSTIAFQLSIYLHQTCGLKVAVIDLDPQGNLSAAFLARAENKADTRVLDNFSSYLSSDMEPVAATAHGITVFPGDVRLLELEKFELDEVLKAMSIVHDFNHLFDVVVIDTPPTIGNLVLSGVGIADYLIIPHTFDNFSDDGVYNIIRDLKIINARSGHKTALLAIIPTRIDGTDRNQLARVVEALNSEYGQYVSPPIRHRRIARDAMNSSEAVWEVNTRSEGKAEIITCFKWITKRAALKKEVKAHE